MFSAETLGPDRAARVLVVDDELHILKLLKRMLAHEGHEVMAAEDVAQASRIIHETPPDVIVCDVRLPDSDGISLCRSIKQNAATRLMPVVLMTGVDDAQVRLRGLEAGADDLLTKPLDTRELMARVRALAQLKRYTDDLDAAGSIITILVTMIETRDGQSSGHCHRMANYSTALGRALGLSSFDIQTLHRGGFLHDIGMLAIPEPVLRKTAPLTSEEFELIKSHTDLGDRLCAHLRSLQPVRPIVRHHHERLDGSGYPDGLRGDAIPLLAQIVGIVDVYEAVTSQRPYQQTQSVDDAVELLKLQADRGWRRRDLVNAFAGLVEQGRFDAPATTVTAATAVPREIGEG
jgi:putative two-component system response regulator